MSKRRLIGFIIRVIFFFLILAIFYFAVFKPLGQINTVLK